MPGMPWLSQTLTGYLHYWSLGEALRYCCCIGDPMFAVQYAKGDAAARAGGISMRSPPTCRATDCRSRLITHRVAKNTPTLSAAARPTQVKRANVVGMLTGGVVSLAFATHQSARTRCLVLQNTPLYSEEELAAQLAAPAPDTRIWADGRHATERCRQRASRPRKLDRARPRRCNGRWSARC